MTVPGSGRVRQSSLQREGFRRFVGSKNVRKRENVRCRRDLARVELFEGRDVGQHMIEIGDETAFLRLGKLQPGQSGNSLDVISCNRQLRASIGFNHSAQYQTLVGRNQE